MLFLFLALSSLSTYAQNTALRASLQIIPPYSVYLSDYVASEANKLNISIFVSDPDPDDLLVKLKFTILGEGISIETNNNFNPVPIRLSTGNNFLSTADFANYFEPRHLNFQGLDKVQFLKTGRLKEGIYQFCVEVLEYNRNIKLSERACATAWLLLNNPPIWNLPQANEIVQATNPQNILFNWTPQHTGSPNAAFATEYEFTLVEIWPIDRNPNDAINAQLPLYRTNTANSSLIYGPSEPALIPGRKYAARIKAFDKQGRDLFIQGGYSEVRVFTFGESCLPPPNQKVQIENFQKARVSWTNNSNHSEYLLRYRPQGTSNWYFKRTIFQYGTLDSLIENTLFEYQLKANCGSLESDYSPIDTFRLPTKPQINFDCRYSPLLPSIDKSNPKSQLLKAEVLSIGDYEVTITQASGENGIFSGKGVVVVPFMNHIKVAAQFKNISVNSNNQVTAGSISIQNAGVQAFDDKTRENIKEQINITDKWFETANNYIDKADHIIEGIGKTVDKIPEITKNALEEGKNYMEKGLQLINDGKQLEGTEMFEKGKKIFQNTVKTLEDNGSLAQMLGLDKLKELFQKVLKEKSLQLGKDSTGQYKLLSDNNSKFEKLKMEFENTTYTSSTEDKIYLESADVEEEEDVALEPNILNKPSSVFNTNLSKELHNLSSQKFELEIDFKNIQDKLLWLNQYTIGNVPNIETLIDEFKREAVTVLKKYALDKLNNKETEDLEKQIRIFAEKKLNEIIVKKG